MLIFVIGDVEGYCFLEHILPVLNSKFEIGWEV